MKILLARLFKRPGIAVELIVASFLANILALASPLFVIQVLNRYVSYGVDATLATLTAGVVIAILLEFGFRQLRPRLAVAINAPHDEALLTNSFDVLTGAKAATLGRLPPGVRREVLHGGDTIQAAYSPSNIASLMDVPFALIFVGVLFLLSPLIALVVSSFLIALLMVSIAGLWSLRSPSRDLLSVSGRRNSLIDSAIKTADTVRAFNAAGFLRRLWRGEAATIQKLRHRVAARQGFVQSMTGTAQGLMSVAVIAIGAMLVVAGEMDVGLMIGANILAARALGPIARLAQLSEVFVKARQANEMLKEFAKLPQEPVKGSALKEYKGTLEFRDLAFAYPGATTPIFESLSLKLVPGSILIVTGSNGTGKTTLARLLMGLLEPSRGQILVDGVDLAQIVPEWWRKQVIYLPQEPRFFNATLRDNLTIQDPNLEESELNKVIAAAGLQEFIDQSTTGFEMEVADNGDNLPVGIRRRLALARALVCDGMLALFDEPTEGMDSEGCERVYAVMNGLSRRGRTIIAFSHDSKLVKGATVALDLNSKPVPELRTLHDTPRVQSLSQGVRE